MFSLSLSSLGISGNFLGKIFKAVRLDLITLPSGNTRVEDLIHLFKSSSFGLVCEEKHGNGGEGIEGSEDEVSLVFDVLQHGRDCIGQSKVESPVAGGSKGNSLCTNIGREDLSWVCPRDRSPRGCEPKDKQCKVNQYTRQQKDNCKR